LFKGERRALPKNAAFTGINHRFAGFDNAAIGHEQQQVETI